MEERKKRNIKKKIRLEKSVGVREREKGSKSGGKEKEGRAGEVAAHQS